MGTAAFLMLLYIDDDSVDGVLIRRLIDSGYNTTTTLSCYTIWWCLPEVIIQEFSSSGEITIPLGTCLLAQLSAPSRT